MAPPNVKTTVWTITVNDELVEIFSDETKTFAWLVAMKFNRSRNYPWLWHRSTDRAEVFERDVK